MADLVCGIETIMIQWWALLAAPFFGIHLVGMALNARVAVIVWALQVWTVCALGLLGYRGWVAFRHSPGKRSMVWFWGVWAAILFLPGVYLEFPSDSWEHVRRIFEWNNAQDLRDHRLYFRFGYLYYYAWLKVLPLASVRWGYSLVSGLAQLGICVSFYNLVRRLGLDRGLSQLQVVVFWAYFGTSVFGLRYYMLAPMAIAYLFYFVGLCGVMDVLAGKRAGVFTLLVAFVATFLNHRQEFRFLALAVCVLGGVFLVGRSSNQKRWLVLSGILALAGVLSASIPIVHDSLYRFGPGFVTVFRGLAFWRSELRVVSTWGVPGAVGILMALAFFRRYSQIAALTLVPPACLIFPPASALLMFTASNASDVYRICYFFPPSVALTLGLCGLLQKMNLRPSGIVIGAVLVGIACIPTAPIYGRALFQLYRVPAALSLGQLEGLVQWLHDTRRYTQGSFILTDDATSFGLYAYGVDSLRSARLSPAGLIDRMDSVEAITSLLPSDRLCSVIALVDDTARGPQSWTGRLSGHWSPQAAYSPASVQGAFSRAAQKLKALGWEHHRIEAKFDVYDRVAAIREDYFPGCYY